MSLAPPARLGRYLLLRHLGEGGQGSVWEAEQELPGGLRRRVAVKRLEHRAEDLFREAGIGNRLRHPHLVDVYELGRDGEIGYCAMELCEGGSLEGRALPPRAVIEVGLQVCDALTYAHRELELVHLDLKPANLLLRDGAVKVADLGIARARGFGADGRIRGTPRFMAPEQRVGAPVDARADVYALGWVLAELATGRPSAGSETLVDPGDAPTGAEVPAWLRPVVERCTEPDARDRYPSMEAVAEALRALPADGPGLRELFGTDRPDPGLVLGPGDGALVGRRDALGLVAAALEAPGVLTLKGAAGIGKTALAREAARRYGAGGAEARFVDLSGAADLPELLRRVAAALELSLRGDVQARIRRIGDALGGRGAPLLVLDGFERQVGHAALLGDWLGRAPEARLLVTSRVPLGVPGERVVEVGPLDDAAAVALLVERAARRGVDVAGEPLLVDLARRLDGLPLALELAAGRLGIWSLAELLERLDLSLLRSGALGLAPRQATLRGALDWSWELLDERERSALARLSVFRGGFLPDDVAAVVEPEAEALEALQRLWDHSLVLERDGRLDLMGTVAAWAAERLEERGEGPVAERRHAAWFGRERRGARGTRPRVASEELPNLVAAVHRSIAAGDPVRAGHAALAAASVYRRRGPMDEAIALLGAALPGCPPALAAEVRVYRAGLEIDAGRHAEAEEDLGIAGSLAGDGAELAQERGDLALARGRLDEAAEHYGRSLALREATGAPIGRALLCLGAVELQAGTLDRAEVTCRRAIAALRAAGDRDNEASALGNLGIVLRKTGRPDEARALYLEALALGERAGERAGPASDHANLAILEAHAGRLDAARAHFETSIALFRACGIRGHEAQQRGNLAELVLMLGRPDEARAHAEVALAVQRELGNARLQAVMLQLLARAEDLTGDPRRARALLEEAVAVAGVGGGGAAADAELARLDLAEGRPAEALGRLERALGSLRERGPHEALARAWRGEALAAVGRTDEARAELDASITALRSQSPPMAVLASCAAARAFADPARLADAEALAAEAGVRPGSPTAVELARTAAALRRR